VVPSSRDAAAPGSYSNRQVTLIDLLDRLLAGGVVISGHITLTVADIDLVELDLAIILAATDKMAGR
jgi:hypothetical protein